MMKRKIHNLASITLLLLSLISFSPNVLAAAAQPDVAAPTTQSTQSNVATTTQKCGTGGTGIINANSLPQPCADQNTLNNIMNIVFVIVGAVAVLMVVIAGFRYIRAGSNETVAAESRRQLAHAIVGLIVVASAAVIVNFVLDRVG